MKCPSCVEQLLDTLSTPFGTWDRCPSCHGIFIHQDLIVSASHDSAQCKAALEETRALLLPTERTCPKCLQKLFDGRVRSRGVIFSLCPTCQSLWTSPPVLRQFEELIEKTLAAQAEQAMAGAASDSAAVTGAAPGLGPKEDTAFGSVFRAFARTFDRMADSVGRSPADKILKEEKEAKKAKAAKPAKEQKPPKPAKLIQSVEPVLPPESPKPVSSAKPVEPLEEPPKIEIPEFIFPEPAPETVPEPIPEPVREQIQESEPAPAPEPEREPAPLPETPPPKVSVPEPVKEIIPEPASSSDRESSDELRRLMLEGPGAKAKSPAQSNKEEPKEQIPKKEAPPIAKPTPKPAIPPVVKPAPKSAPPTARKRTGFMGKLKAAWSPTPKKIVSAPKLVEPVQPAPNPISSKPSISPAPQKAKPAPTPPKAKPAPTPPKEKSPKEPFDHKAFWPPWLLAVLSVILSAFRDYGFEGGPAGLWGIMGGSIGLMVRLARLYPFGAFQTNSLQRLADSKAALGWRGIPVILEGEIVPLREEDPKGVVVFRQDGRTIALNRLGRWDLLPRLFGLANPRQLLKGPVILKGWFRDGLTPWLEVHDLRSGKTSRKSMTKALRWVMAVMGFVIALTIYLSLD